MEQGHTREMIVFMEQGYTREIIVFVEQCHTREICMDGNRLGEMDGGLRNIEFISFLCKSFCNINAYEQIYVHIQTYRHLMEN